jgi:hypothetical protein
MGVLSNQRHELFARALAEGKSLFDAHKEAGYKPNRGNASKLADYPKIQDRVKQITTFTAMRAETSSSVTLEGLISDAARIERAAFADKQYSAAATALTARAKLAGLWIERGENTNQNTTYVVSDKPMTEEEWVAERVTEH